MSVFSVVSETWRDINRKSSVFPTARVLDVPDGMARWIFIQVFFEKKPVESLRYLAA